MTGTLGLHALFGLLAGSLIGFVHFGSLWWNTRLFGRGDALPALGLQVLRLGLLALVLFGLTKAGAVPLLTGTLGLLMARRVLLRRLGGVA
ncbi:MAG: ATP synthase subunit I [Acetobacteraceae bacterium]